MIGATNINLKLLQTFAIVAENRSFRAAAIETNRSQSAVSAQIKRLEEQLGLKLFHRTTRSVELTAEGKCLLDGTRRAMAEINASLRQIQESLELGRGQVTLSSSPTTAAVFLPGILAEFEADFPTVQVRVREVGSEDLVGTVLADEVDFALGQGLESSAELEFTTICEDPLIAIAAPNFGLRRGSAVELAELAALPLLMLAPGSAFRITVDEVFAAHGFTDTSHIECKNVHTLISMADAGLGVSVIPLSALRPGRLTRANAHHIKGEGIFRPLSLIRHRGRNLSPVAERFAELAIQRIREYPPTILD